MSIHGTLKTMTVADLLQFLAAGHKTGTLKIGHSGLIKQIYLEDGLIVGSTSNDPKEFLGQVLLHQPIKLLAVQARSTRKPDARKLHRDQIVAALLDEQEIATIAEV